MPNATRFFFLLLILASSSEVAVSQTTDQAKDEIRSLASLACSNDPDQPRKDEYAALLQQAIDDQRTQLPQLKLQLQHTPGAALNSAKLVDLLDAEISALGDHQKSACDAAKALEKVMSPPDIALAQGVALSTENMELDKTAPGDSTSSSFTITNKTQDDIHLYDVTVKECKETTCEGKSEDFLVKPGKDCSSGILAKAEHCDYTVTFSPRTGGHLHAQAVVDITGKNGVPKHSKIILLSGVSEVADVAKLNAGTSNPTFRAVAGFDITGASSADTEQKAFLEFDMNAPIGHAGAVKMCKDPATGKQTSLSELKKRNALKDKKHCPDGAEPALKPRIDALNRKWWWFFNPRITSLPQSATALANLNVQGFSDFFSSRKTDLVQGIDVSGGVEYALVKARNGLPFLGSYKNAHPKMALALVAGVGATSPFSTPGSNPTIFSLASASPLRHQFQTTDPATGKLIDIPSAFTNIAFVDRERSRFFRKYYAGIRLKSYNLTDLIKGDGCDPDFDFANRRCEALINAFPGIIDLTAGKDEQVTGGHLNRWILRVDAVYPIPFISGFTIFGGINAALVKNRSTNPLILPTTSGVALSDPSVFIVNVEPRDRDIYRIGLGVDLFQLIKKKTNTQDSQQPPDLKPAGSGSPKTPANGQPQSPATTSPKKPAPKP